MSSPAQIAANRANAQLSTGPVTAAGKETVSQNSLRHGLAGRVHAALPGEEEPFAQHCLAYREALSPAGVIEEDLVEDIAADRWRLKRARALENSLFAQIEEEQSGELDPVAAQAQAWVDPRKGLQRLALYAARIQRAIERNTAALKALQSERKAAYAQAQQEAIALTGFAESNGQTYDPGMDFEPASAHGGFAYSAPEIARQVGRASRLVQAQASLRS